MLTRIFSSHNKYSNIVYLLCLVTYIWVATNNHNYVIGFALKHDTVQYYSYLPACFIYHDLTYSYKKELNDFYKEEKVTLLTPDRKSSKMTSGVSILYSPFFFMGHLYAKITNARSDGYSRPYEIFICIAGIFYGLLGLFLLKQILLNFFNDTVTAMSLLAIALGTNFFYYAVLLPTRVPVFNFFLFTAFIYALLKWEKYRSIKYAVFLGLSGGLIFLIRPTNAIILIFFLLFGVHNLPTLKKRLVVFKSNFSHLILMASVAFLVLAPQLLYWKTITGHWIYYSYGDEKLFLLNPKIIQGLFSYRKGWLVYTPIMCFSLLGFYHLYKRLKELFYPILIFTILNIYLIFSWWCWWYGGCFGSRPMIESYVLLSFPLACFISVLKEKYIYIFKKFIAVYLLLILLNLFQSYQYKICLIHYESMTKESYWASFLKIDFPPEYKKLLKNPNYKEAMIDNEK